MGTVTLTIDGTEVKINEGATVLEAAQSVGIYIPALCYHPDLQPAPGTKVNDHIYRGDQLIKNMGSNPNEFEGCKLCVVEIEGMEGFPTACNTSVSAGMIIHTNTQQVQELRRDNLAKILAKHPHACLVCAEKEGCSREPCSLNVPVDERCCDMFGRCELQKVAEYIGIREDIPRYVFRELPVEENALFIRDHNLCISCGRCVRVCRDIRGVEALGIVYDGDDFIVGNVGPSLEKSGCRFCTACVEVCPTGALMDKDVRWGADREEDIVPCKHTCPVGIDVPRYIRLVSEKKFAEAAAVVREKVPLPSVLGYVCHHPCETECRRGKVNEAMSICGLKRFAAEHDTGLWKSNFKVASPTGKNVGIVGSGPAGLTAAYYLARKGHSVTVFESLPEYGGMMRVGAPGYRLPKEVLERDVAEIKALGVEIRTDTRIGEKLTLEDLENQYQAVFLAVGAPLSRRLNIEGVELNGVLWGVDCLRDVNLGHDVKVENRVLVIGGGSVAIDVARTAFRLGAEEVQLACLESRGEMPAHEWEIEEAVNEGVVLNVSWGPKKILGDGEKVTRMELVRCTSVFDEEGKFNPSFDETETKFIETDMVILAIGQASDLSFLVGSGIQLIKGSIKVDKDTLQTGASKIFAGGDVLSGPASVIEAIAMGRKAAISIDKYLGGDGVIDETLIEPEKPNPWLGREEGFADRKRVQMPTLPVEQRFQDFSAVELGFCEEEAVEEAKRCLRCDLRLQISSVALPPEKWLEFNAENVGKVPETSGVYQLLDDKKTVIYIAGTPNLRQGLEEKLKTVEKAHYFGFEEHPMYTMRESELIQKFLKEHGKMPELNEELLDLF